MRSEPGLSGNRPKAGRQSSPSGWRGWVGWGASLLLAVVFAARALERFAGTPQIAAAVGLLLAFLVLFLVQPRLVGQGEWLDHLYFGLQSALVVGLLSLPPHPDVVTALFVVLALQAALAFPPRTLVVWIAGLLLLMAVPLMIFLGWVPGLAMALLPAVGCIILPAYVLAHREIETARTESQALLDGLLAAQHRLQAYAAQAEELAAVEERNRLARELHDSVSQTIFSLSLNARAARVYLERDPAKLQPQLERLQALAQDALAEIRSLIEQLRLAGGAP